MQTSSRPHCAPLLQPKHLVSLPIPESGQPQHHSQSNKYLRQSLLATMCGFTKNYYIYMSCVDPGTHFCKTSTDGNRKQSCPEGPHERYIVIPENCPLCCG
ncbi:hypothetical protein EDB81DRAFT_704843 [Dactylonectria macrodidyma]|uniref:Uncharacterized protein n=2 Tax=Dactylonectria TaxID=1620264 RepID=A0A9P9CWR8_9HYPO|nr:hypothetical protein EDB81DRAFT_704843 [Dactylonectria macrodidyma]